MYNRQKVILETLKNVGGCSTKIQLFKWFFLLLKESTSGGGNAFYQFLPYKFGPYSFSLSYELKSLCKKGYLSEEKETWTLTSLGKKVPSVLSNDVKEDISHILGSYGNMSQTDLLDYVYSTYPWFTVNSVMQNRRAQTRSNAKPAIYSLGYESIQVDGFLDRLMLEGVECIVDVRRNPVARRFGFHKSTLMRLCSQLGMQYYHFPEFGIKSEDRVTLDSFDDYLILFRKYESYLKSLSENAYDVLLNLVSSKPSALICMEADPQYCHRSRLANVLAEQSDLSINHLVWSR